MLACRIFLLPCLYFCLSCERIGLENPIYDPWQLSACSVHIFYPAFVALDMGVGIETILLGFCCYRELRDLLWRLIASDFLLRSLYVEDQGMFGVLAV